MTIHTCYCSENLVGLCTYCIARDEIRALLNKGPGAQEPEDFDVIFDKYAISPKARLDILFDIELGGPNSDPWFNT